MKIKIKNLGPIYEFNFDLNKDLHLVYGKNNIGKSHGIAAVYLILKTLSENFNALKLSTILQRHVSDFLDTRDGKLVKMDSMVSEFAGLFAKIIYAYFEDIIIPNLNKSFANSFSEINNIGNKWSNEDLLIEIYFDFFDIKIGGLDENASFFVSKIAFNKDPNIILNGNKLIQKQILNQFKDSFKGVLSFANAIYFLPASRSSLYQGMNVTAPLLAEISRTRHLLPNKTFQIPTFSEPISDYFLQLMSVNPNGKSDAFNRIAETIENDILQGSIVFNNQNKKYEYVQHKTDLCLEVTFASSMISELAPLVAYLKYILKEEKGDKKTTKCLFIEEPEAHLHPSVQVVLMQLFTELANNGVKVIMTTHSDFMFNELSNLILDNKIKAEQVASMHLVMTEKAVLTKEICKQLRKALMTIIFQKLLKINMKEE